jgi:transcriptional regulator with GAF, ATPase, and Fis domain
MISLGTEPMVDSKFEDMTPDRATLLALFEATRAITNETEPQGVFDQITARVCAILKSEAASLQLLDPERQQLIFQASCGPGAEQLIGQRFDAKLGIAGKALRTRRALRVDNAPGDPSFFAGIDKKTLLSTRSILAVPLIVGDRVVGVLEAINPVGRERFNDADLELVQIFASLAAGAASQAQAFDHVKRENRAFSQAAGKSQIVGRSPAILHTLQMCQTVAAATTTVLLLGETGTGKELAAKQIHALSPCCDKPFIAINCAAVQENLLESELFGHEKGAFTGALAQKPGVFELASGGTLFLDEVGEMSQALQAKLLRVLQEREFVRVGGTRKICSDARVIAATNRNLKQEMAAGRFREDLYYRLSVFPIELPPLRQRIDDVPLLIDHFLRQIAPSIGRPAPAISAEAMKHLTRYQWPGNIRELRNIVERCALLAGEVVGPEHLPIEITAADSPPASSSPPPPDASQLAIQERSIIVEALNASQWNCSAAARRLGITRDILRTRIKKHGLKPSTDTE